MSLCVLLAAASVHAAAGGKKDWKDDETGKADNDDKWVGGKPGNSDVAKIRNGKVTVDEPTAAPLTILGLELSGTGTIEGGGTLTLLGQITIPILGLPTLVASDSSWTGGVIDNVTINTSDATTTLLGTSISFNIGSGSAKNLKNNAKLNLLGASTWDGSEIATGNSAQINNSGAFTVTGSGRIAHDTTLAGGRSTFTNNGTFTKHTDTGTAELETVFNNHGNVTVSTGKLKLSGGGTSHGNVTVAGGATLELSDRDYTFAGGTLDGAGIIDLTSATTSFNATSGAAHLKVSGGTARFDGAHTGTGHLSLGSGTVTGNGTAEFGSLTWTGGALGGKVKSIGDATIGSGAKTLSGALTLGGNTTWDGSTITGDTNATLTSEAGKTFAVRGDGAITNAGNGRFLNQGTFVKTTGDASSSTDIHLSFESSGEILLNTGNLKFLGGGHSSANVSIGSGAELEIAGTDFAFTGGALNGTGGKLKLSDKTTTFTNATSGDAEIALTSSTATARFDGIHSGTGKLSLASGTVSGTGTADFATLDWSGGALNAKVKSRGDATIGGTDAKTLGGDLTLGGNTTWNGSLLNATSSAKIKNEAGKTFTATSDGILASDGTAAFTNLGTFEKTSGKTGDATEIQARFDSSGAIKATGGTLKLLGGGQASGHVEIGATGKLQIAGGNYTFDGAALSGDGTLELSGATTTFKGASGSGKISVNGGIATFDTSKSSASKLTLLSGIVSSANGGSAEVTELDWSAGTLNAKLKSTSATLGTGAKTLSSTAELTLAGTTSWNGSHLHAEGSGKIKNEAGATFTATADGTLSTGGNATFTNLGTFEKTAGSITGVTDIQTRFENSGHLKATAGTVKLSGGGNSSGAVTIGSGASVQLSGNAFAFTGGAINGASGKLLFLDQTTTFTNATSGDAEFEISGGSATARFDGTHTGSGKLKLSAGTLAGTGTAEFSSLDWSGGALDGKVKSNGATTIGHGTKSLAGELTLAGATTWDGGVIGATGGSKIKNEATRTFTAHGDGSITSDGTATFTNLGTFEKSGRDPNTTTDVQARFDNSGAIKTNGGTLKLSGGGTASGLIDTASGAKLQISAADYAFDGAAFSGDGTVELGANTKIKGATGSGKFSILGGSANFDTSTSTAARLALSSGTVTTSNGGSADVGTFEWSGGTLNGKVKSAAGTFNHDPKSLLTDADLSLTGSTTWDGSSLSAHGNAKLKNEATGTFTVTGDGTLANTGSATFTNLGIFEKTQGHGGATDIQSRFDSTGHLKATDGTLRLTGGGASSGHVTVGSNGRLQIAGSNNYTFENAAFAGDGAIELSGANTKFKGNSGSVRLNVAGGNADLDTSELSASRLQVSSGAVNSANGGSASVTALAWSGGTLNARIKSASATFSGGAKHLASGADLQLGGATLWDGSAINASGNAKIRNLAGAVFLASADGLLANTGSAVFTNEGTFIRSTGNGGSTTVQARFDNHGLVTVHDGKLVLTGGGKNAAHAQIIVAAAAGIDISGDLELFANSILAGDGTARLLSGTFTAHGAVAIKHVAFEGGSLGGSPTFHGIVDWNDGLWNSAHAGATTTIASGGTLNLRSNATHDFSGRSIVNDGTVNWHAGHLRGGNGSSFTNNSVFNDLNAANRSITSSSGTASFTNHGEYRKSQAGTTTVDVPFTNHGTIKVSAGSLVFNSTFTNHGTFNLTNGAQAQFHSPVDFGTAPLTGVGTINAPAVIAGGIVAPGVSPGTLNITGTLTLLATSSLLIELGGATPGSGYDVLNVGGAGVLGGKLGVTFLDGFQWTLPANATFTILTANGGLTGAFANIANGSRLASLDGAATFQVNYGLGSSLGVNSVILSNFVVAVPEPSTYALLGLGGLIVLLTLRRRKK